jgi:histidyl-tRNA synthetase
MTPTLARMVAARKGAFPLPLKWYTIAQCFRYERMTRGRKREHYQWNLDILGEPSVSAETELIGAAVQTLSLLGLTPENIRIHYSSRALLSDLLKQLGIPPDHHASVFLALDKRGKQDDDAIRTLLKDAGVGEDTISGVFQLMDLNTLDEALALLEQNGSTPTGEDLRQFIDLTRTAGLSDWLLFDISIIRGLSYYTGIVFEAFDTSRSLRAVLGGGRYDNLLGLMGGEPLPGVGLGFGDVVIAELLKTLEAGDTPPPPLDLAVGFMQPEQQQAAVLLAARFRRAGQRVDLALKPEKPRAFFSRTGKTGVPKALYVGPDDVASGTVRIKDMATREEDVIKI